jgi:hypothetical protein
MYIETTIGEVAGSCPLLLKQTSPVDAKSKTYSLKGFLSRVTGWLSSVFGSRCNTSYEQWRQLEYRNEMATRLGERMNPFPLI